MRHGDSGPEVQQLQLGLLKAGYKLPKYGADGDFGGETTRALLAVAMVSRLTWDPDTEVPEPLLDLFGVGVVDDSPPVGQSSSIIDLEGVKLYDLRHKQTNPHPKGKTGKDGRTVVRLASAIDSLMLHQAGIPFGVGDGWEDEFETVEEALAHRGLDVACHAIAFRPGFLVLPADPLWYISHGNGVNSRSFGLETDGLFPGLVGGKTPGGKPETNITPELVHAVRMGVKLLFFTGRNLGCQIKIIWGHRQTDSWKRADPGEELWCKVVLEYAVPVLGLETRPHETFRHHKGRSRDGLPIPLRWDPAGSGKY